MAACGDREVSHNDIETVLSDDGNTIITVLRATGKPFTGIASFEFDGHKYAAHYRNGVKTKNRVYDANGSLVSEFLH